MKLYILLGLVLLPAHPVSEVNALKKNAPAANPPEIAAPPAAAPLSAVQKRQFEQLYAEIPNAFASFRQSEDAETIAQNIDTVTARVDELLTSLPPGLLRNSLQQGSDALNLAYLFRFENRLAEKMPADLKAKAIRFYRIENLAPAAHADKIFDFAQAHFEIAARIAGRNAAAPLN